MFKVFTLINELNFYCDLWSQKPEEQSEYK